jgi:hypothetical protein
VRPQGVVEGVKSHQLKTCRINILNLTVERCDANEIGCPLHDRRESSFLGVSQPLLKGDRRLIGPGIQQQLFRSGWKGVAKTACGKCGISATSTPKIRRTRSSRCAFTMLCTDRRISLAPKP